MRWNEINRNKADIKRAEEGRGETSIGRSLRSINDEKVKEKKRRDFENSRLDILPLIYGNTERSMAEIELEKARLEIVELRKSIGEENMRRIIGMTNRAIDERAKQRAEITRMAVKQAKAAVKRIKNEQ